MAKLVKSADLRIKRGLTDDDCGWKEAGYLMIMCK